jgi:hypothetical protein
MKIRVCFFFFLIVFVGCFAKPKKVNGPTKLVTPAVTPQDPNPPEGNTTTGLLTIHELFSWSVTGESPLASWSPDKKLLAVSADDPQQAGLKFLTIVDLTTGKILGATKVIGNFTSPEWLNNSTIGFDCPERYCGKGKSGIYTVAAQGGEPQLILPLPSTSSGTFYPTKEKILLLVMDVAPYPGHGMMPDPTYQWYQVDPAAQKATVTEKQPLVNGYPAGIIRFDGCMSEFNDVFTYSDQGKMTVSFSGMEESQGQVFAKAAPMPRYPGDDLGVPPCFSEDVDRGIYYSRDAKTGLGKATLIKVEGYIKPEYYKR